MNNELQLIFGDYLVMDSIKIPVAENKYTGDENTYIVWSIIFEEPALSANDEVLASIVTVDIDIFSNKNYLKIENKIKKLMKANDWVWTGDNTDNFNENTGFYHETCSFEKERMI